MTGWLIVVVTGMCVAGVPRLGGGQDSVAIGPAVEIEGITFASDPSTVYVPTREAAEAAGWSIRWDAPAKRLYLSERAISPKSLTRFLDGSLLIAATAIAGLCGDDDWKSATAWTPLFCGPREIRIRAGVKRVEIDLTKQELRAWQGERLVLSTHVSTGRPGHSTPAGSYRAGPIKSRMHYSRLYNNAAMPWSVQVSGNVFIHGFSDVPDEPASHGCIRVPLTGGNPARWFYEWVEVGTSIDIVRSARSETP